MLPHCLVHLFIKFGVKTPIFGHLIGVVVQRKLMKKGGLWLWLCMTLQNNHPGSDTYAMLLFLCSVLFYLSFVYVLLFADKMKPFSNSFSPDTLVSKWLNVKYLVLESQGIWCIQTWIYYLHLRWLFFLFLVMKRLNRFSITTFSFSIISKVSPLGNGTSWPYNKLIRRTDRRWVMKSDYAAKLHGRTGRALIISFNNPVYSSPTLSGLLIEI